MIASYPDSLYVFPDEDEPIQQGDIFRWLPRPSVVLGEAALPILQSIEDEGAIEIDWMEWAQSGAPIIASVEVRPVTGIVINQDCDTLRADNLALAEVRPFPEVDKEYPPAPAPGKQDKFVDWVTRQSQKNRKWFYLPPEDRVGFSERMAADFRAVFAVPLDMLMEYRRDLRVGRLNDEVARPHFRERIAEFFRRYPLNEWYPFTSTELATYEKLKGVAVARYPWQPPT